MFKLIAKINKIVLPSFTKQGLNPIYAKKWQKHFLPLSIKLQLIVSTNTLMLQKQVDFLIFLYHLKMIIPL